MSLSPQILLEATSDFSTSRASSRELDHKETRFHMDEASSSKFFCSVTSAQDGQHQESDCLAMTVGDTRLAGSCMGTHPASKPFAYVKPMRKEMSAHSESTTRTASGQHRRRARSQRSERVPRQNRSAQARWAQLLGRDLQLELDNPGRSELADPVRAEARPSLTFPPIDTMALYWENGYDQRGHVPPLWSPEHFHIAFPLSETFQREPEMFWYWNSMRSPVSSEFYPYIEFQHPASASLLFAYPSSSLYQYGGIDILQPQLLIFTELWLNFALCIEG